MKRLVYSIGLITVALVAWFWFLEPMFFPPSELSADPQVAELQQMQHKMVERVSADAGQLPDEDQMRTMGDKIRSLSDEQRGEFFQSSRSAMMSMMEARMKRFFTLSPAEQQKQLDADIDRMQKMRESGKGFGFGRDRRGGGGGSGDANQKGQSGGEGGKSQAGDSQETRRKRFSEMTAEERNERRKGMLSHTTPENRAMFTEYRSKMNDRMRERGMTVPSR